MKNHVFDSQTRSDSSWSIFFENQGRSILERSRSVFSRKAEDDAFGVLRAAILAVSNGLSKMLGILDQDVRGEASCSALHGDRIPTSKDGIFLETRFWSTFH